MESKNFNIQFKKIIESFEEASELQNPHFSIHLLDLIVAVLGNAHTKGIPSYILKFEELGGYETIPVILSKQMEKEDFSKVLDCILQLSFMGPEDLLQNVMEIEKDTPFQSPTFFMPVPLPGTFLFLSTQTL